MFYVIELLDKSVISVPSSWCDENLSSCQYPAGNKDLSSRKRKMEPIDTEKKWKKLEISKILFTEGNI